MGFLIPNVHVRRHVSFSGESDIKRVNSEAQFSQTSNARSNCSMPQRFSLHLPYLRHLRLSVLLFVAQSETRVQHRGAKFATLC